MKGHLLHLFRYTCHANEQIIEALEALPADDRPARAVRLLDHLLRAQDVWLGRIQGTSDLPEIWGKDSLSECRTRSEASTERWLQFLHRCTPDAFTKTIRYENSKGEPFTNELREIVSHVVNHSTHHRAQIATLIREAGATPPVTDYIFWAREANEHE